MSQLNLKNSPKLNTNIYGVGLGLRVPHVKEVLENADDPKVASIPWFEVLVDNWLVDGGLNHDLLLAICDLFPIVLHGVGLSLGGTQAIDFNYLKKIKDLKDATGAHWYSEHLSFSSSNHRNAFIPDLLPLPYTEEAVRHLKERILKVQDYLGEQILIENISSYLSCHFNEMSEPEFVSEVAEQSDCHVLFDINNAYVNSYNFNVEIDEYFTYLPKQRVKQIHLAGYEHKGDYLLDAHNQMVSEPVWEQYQRVIQFFGPVPSMIEWDSELPSLGNLVQERQVAEEILLMSQSIDNPRLFV